MSGIRWMLGANCSIAVHSARAPPGADGVFSRHTTRRHQVCFMSFMVQILHLNNRDRAWCGHHSLLGVAYGVAQTAVCAACTCVDVAWSYTHNLCATTVELYSTLTGSSRHQLTGTSGIVILYCKSQASYNGLTTPLFCSVQGLQRAPKSIYRYAPSVGAAFWYITSLLVSDGHAVAPITRGASSHSCC
jgi:hypothetical protein